MELKIVTVLQHFHNSLYHSGWIFQNIEKEVLIPQDFREGT